MIFLYSSSRAVKETHMKRRLAWSTSSNLSYILFGVTLMSPYGLLGALLHFIAHAFTKICSFSCAGAIIHETERTYVHELDGLAYKLPVVFSMFAVSSLSLMGVPGFAGFISKWYLAAAAVESQSGEAYLGVIVLLISALLTAIYMMTMVVRGFFPEKGFDENSIQEFKAANWKMSLPIAIFAVMILLIGLYSGPLIDFLTQVSFG